MESSLMTLGKIPRGTARERTANGPTELFKNDEDRWAAVVHRDSRADGVFFYSVRSTGVYCRPSCGARLARRENVRFHASALAAQDQGFRPCKRCRPHQSSLRDRRSAAIATACREIEVSEETPDLDAIASRAGMSRFHFQRVFRSVTGLTPKAYATAHRAQRVRERLQTSSTVTDAIYEAGFNSSGRFYATSGQMLGMTPTAFRNGAPDSSIRFAVGKCSLGSVLVATSEKGVCAILFGEDPRSLAEDLRSLFPNAQLLAGDGSFKDWVLRVVEFVEAPGLGLDLPLDIRGTVFQRRVWKALQQIPAGSTLSYAQVARKVGLPRSARAVAQACASNKLAVAIPCHRVVRSNGELSGYRWGVKRKEALLSRERGREGGRERA